MSRIKEKSVLRARMGEPGELAAKKTLRRIDKYARTYIERSPFLCIGTADENGNADVSPRGDPPGFVRVVDDNTIIIPDRPGNNRVDTMSNIIANPQVGILFIIPGIDDTLRVNGKAEIIDDPAELAPAAVNGRPPKLGIRVHVEEVFFHCAKAFRRSSLWVQKSHVDRGFLPGLAHMVMEQARACEVDLEESDKVEAEIQEDYKTKLY
ncbi:pyridoxamine 5'-phosphate oxidase family protein [Taklimakanibacter lacteus]|uniref:pyridoxamine 5'-phosphate oxidase family protein n=1 Tax=Taklimakanibacter lacteus TaxID=2268456 RepID=UPI000E66B856